MTPLGHLTRRLQNLLQIARTTTACDDSGAVQTVQVKTKGGGVRDAVPVQYHYGFSAHLPLGTDVSLLNVTGDSTSGVIVGSGHQTYRKTGLTAGQTQLYDLTGTTFLLDAGGGILATPSARNFTIQGDLAVTGNIIAGTGASGTFTTPTGQIVTVQDGLITNIY